MHHDLTPGLSEVVSLTNSNTLAALLYVRASGHTLHTSVHKAQIRKSFTIPLPQRGKPASFAVVPVGQSVLQGTISLHQPLARICHPRRRIQEIAEKELVPWHLQMLLVLAPVTKSA